MAFALNIYYMQANARHFPMWFDKENVIDWTPLANTIIIIANILLLIIFIKALLSY